jgi:hypothetical protein
MNIITLHLSFGGHVALAKAQQVLLEPQEREYIVAQIKLARGIFMNFLACLVSYT